MTHKIILLMLVSVIGVLGLAGCDGGHNHGPGGHSHDSGDDSEVPAGGEASGDGGGGHGEAHELGTIRASGVEAKISQAGELVAGAEVAIEIEVTSGDTPSAIRVWVGAESGRGSEKSRADDEGKGHFHAHVAVPKTLESSHRIWVTIDAGGGKSATTSVAAHR